MKKQKRAQWIGGQIFWDTFVSFRVCWQRGRFGGGKTSLAVMMAARLLAEGRVNTAVSNIPLTFAVRPVAPLDHSAILLDESWVYLETRKDVYDYAAFVRKFEHYLLLPSVFPVHNRLSFFFVQRVFNAYTIGLPLWWYRWGLRDKDVKEYGYFGIWNPSCIFGHYPTKFVAGDDGGISEVIAETSKKAGFKGTRSQQRQTTIDFGSVFESTDIQETLDDFQGSFDLSLQDMENEARKTIRAIRSK